MLAFAFFVAENKPMWKAGQFELDLSRPLVMAILNVTPDSFSDGGCYLSHDDALRHAEQMIADGADIIDIGGESTRPGSLRVPADEEIRRTVPVIAELSRRFEIPISIDTTRTETARAAVDAGAAIINDISGLRFEPEIADVATASGSGLVLMHSLGDFETMHSQPAVPDIFSEVAGGLRRAVVHAERAGVSAEQIVLDIGLGFGKTFDQNFELLANLDRLAAALPPLPLLVGASRKSFIGKAAGDIPAAERVPGSVAAAIAAVMQNAAVVRVHDVKETVQAITVAMAIKNHRIGTGQGEL